MLRTYLQFIATMIMSVGFAVITVFLAFSTEYYGVGALPGGTPIEACSTLMPQHGNNQPRTCFQDCNALNLFLGDEQEPVTAYRCGETHNVVLQRIGSTSFRGFFVQARAFTPVFDPSAPFLGEFIPSNLNIAQTRDCNGTRGSSVTHTDRSDKDSISFTWIAPPFNQAQRVTFWYSVVINFNEFYVRLNTTLFPDERFCSPVGPPTVEPITEVTFSLPNVPLNAQEGNELEVCVSKTGQTQQQFSVRIFTNELQNQARSNEDYVELNTTILFAPEDSSQCVILFIIPDNLIEEQEVFEVVITEDSENAVTNPSRVFVAINDDNNATCGDNEFDCRVEPLCLPQEYVCDGIDDCLFPVDEQMCENGDPCGNEGEFRVSGGATGAEGLVELCYEGRFASFDGNGISVFNASFVCQELGFSGAAVFVNAWREFRTVGSGPVITDCLFNDTHLVECSPSFGEFNHIEDLGIRCLAIPDCNHGNIRLVGGSNEAEGAVQICINGVWGSIMSGRWTFTEARVVCGMLGHNEYGALPIPSFFYENGSSDVLFADFVRCSGSEDRLLDCDLNFRTSPILDNDYLVGVRCDDLPDSGCSDGDVRLVARDSDSSGRVEMCFLNLWRIICSNNWDSNATMVVCKQLGHSAAGSGRTLELPVEDRGLPVAPSIRCVGNELTIQQCFETARKKRQEGDPVCFTGLEAGVDCAVSPRLLLLPPSNNGIYEFQVEREARVSCLVEQNRYYPGPINITVYRVIGDDMVPTDTGSTVISGIARTEAAGTYVCRAENAFGFAVRTIEISVVVPNGPRSRVYVRFSLPRLEDRLIQLFDDEEIDVPAAIEEFLISGALDLSTTPGQQLINCSNASSTLSDIKRKRERYECALDTFPPLTDNPTSLAETIVLFLEEGLVSFTAFNISVPGFCDSEPSAFGVMWPETEANNMVSIPCGDGVVATRVCSPDNDAEWLEPDTSQCGPGPTDPEVPTIEVIFSLPNETLNAEEINNNFIRVCVTKTGQTQQSFDVKIFTNELEDQAQSGEDYQDLDTTLEFDPADSFMCVDLEIVPDNFVEGPEKFEVVISVDSENAVTNPSRVSVVITEQDSVCNIGEYQCQLDDFCLPPEYVCDGINDCLIPHDEIMCEIGEMCENDGEFRLSGGATEAEGLVEVCYEGLFRSICENEISIFAAAFVCRELGFSGGGEWVNALREFGTIGSGPILADCQTNDTHPLECRPASFVCSNLQDAGIRCLAIPDCEHGSIRLVGGNGDVEGAVQICINGVWESISSGRWAFTEARVVCRMLGHNEYGALPIPRFIYENSRSDIITSRFDGCTGSEKSLLDCNFNFRSGVTSDDGYPVGVRCDDLPESGCADGAVRLASRDSNTTGQVEVCLDNMWRSLCASSWDRNDAMVVCRQLNHSVAGLGLDVRSSLEQQSLPPVTLFLQCRGDESNLLQCIPAPARRKRQLNSCSGGFGAGVRCAATPRILLSPASDNGMYVFEVGREAKVTCSLEPNHYYPPPTNMTVYRLIDGEMFPIDFAVGTSITISGTASADDAGIYVCKAENAASSAMITVDIRIEVPSGPRSRVYIRLSLPQLEDRLSLAIESNDVANVTSSIEEFLILEALDPVRTPGQQVVNCTNTSRILSDIKRKRERYECTLDNFPPLTDNPTALAEIVVQYMEEQFIAVSAINISALGFCDPEPSVYGAMWPETEANNMASIPCGDGIMATRVCSPDNGAEWLKPDTSQCDFCCNSTTDNLCIAQDRVCDGIAHCNFLEDELRCPPLMTDCTDGDVRLTLGVSMNDGIVEYCDGGAWGSLCENTFNHENAEVVCRQLGLPSGAALLSNVQSLLPTHPISLSCDGSETRLGECDRALLKDDLCVDFFTRAAVRCQAPVDCEDGDLMLVGGNDGQEGLLQICFNGVWGSVCFNDRDSFSREAAVACNQLGYNPSGALALPRGFFREDPSSIPLLRSVSCSGDEGRLTDCVTNGEGEGMDSEDCRPFPIRCDDYPQENCVSGSVRLRDRVNTREGTVEYCMDGQWGTLCNDQVVFFTESEVQVICRQLGFPPEGFSFDGQRKRQGEEIHTVSFQCNGIESSLQNCDSSAESTDACSGDSYNALTILCFGRPNLYLDPPPTESDGRYVVEVGHPLDVTCNADDTFPNSNIIGYRFGSVTNPEEACAENGEFRFSILDYRNGAPLSAAGDYQCIACNDIGTVTINFAVEIQVPEVEGSSAFLRVSVPNIDRLSVILNIPEEQLEEDLLKELQTVIASTEVIAEEDGIQTIECRFATSTPEDFDARRDRYECNITTFSSTSQAVELADEVANEIKRENIQLFAALITSETGFCSYEVDETMWGTYMWPETSGGTSPTLTCQLDDGIIVTRECIPGGTWNMPVYGDCILRGLDGEVDETNIVQRIAAVAMAAQQADQTTENAEDLRNNIIMTRDLVLRNASLVNEEVVDSVINTLDGLQEWPGDALQADDNGAEIVEAFEIIAITLAQQENFTELAVSNENIAVTIQNVELADLTAGRSLAVSDVNGNLNATVGNERTLAPDQLASGFLPPSLFESFGSDGESIPIIFAILRTGNLFSIDGNQGSAEGVETSVGSPVVSLTVGVNRTFSNLPEPVIVNVRIQTEIFTNPRCVSYDFEQQVWVTDGCTTIPTSDSNLITCECDHLTNFASLVDICTRTEEGGCGQNDDAKLALDVISIIGVVLSGLGLILTIITLLLFKKLRRRDASKFHVQLSLALLGMLVVFVVGIDRTEVFEGCVTVSVLIHYFTLASVMWMGAEAVLMFQKLVIVFVQITTRYFIIVSLICWLAPILPAVIPAAIDPHLMITDTDTNEFCFIGDVRVFFAAFLGPIFGVLLFNMVIFIIVIVVLIKHTKNKLGKTAKDIKAQRKSNIRLAISLFGIMILFGLTWILAAFTISEASLTFQILFAICNSLQGFFIFIFFCVLSPDVRQLWLEKVTCGRYVQSKSSYSNGGKKGYFNGGKKGYNTGQLRSGVNQSGPKTASSGLSALPSSQYATDSSIELSEYPSSTVIDTSSFAKEKEEASQEPSRYVDHPSTSTKAHPFQNPNTEEGKGSTRGASALGAYESMRVSIEFKGSTKR